jgi:hypothetical protein
MECCGSSDIFNPHIIGMGILPAIPSEYGASQELTDFVRICLMMDPSLRPTPSQLVTGESAPTEGESRGKVRSTKGSW